MKKLYCILTLLLFTAIVNVKVASAQTIPDGLSVTGFTLVNPWNDIDMRVLVDYDEFSEKGKFTIRADAGAQTESVVFYLNGIFHHIENEAPYSLFWDHKGDYNQGNLIPGFYTLTAVAYSKNNAKGIQGGALTINFTVYADKLPVTETETLLQETKETVEVSVFPNPVVSTSVIEISGTPDSNVSIALLDPNGGSAFQQKVKLNKEGTFTTVLDASQLKKGTYKLSVKFANKLLTKGLLVE